MVKFEEVYDSQSNMPIKREEAITEIKKGCRDRYDYWCPVCRDKRAQLMIVNLNSVNPYFKIMPNCKHVYSDCPYQLNVKRFKNQVKTTRNYLKTPHNMQAYLQDLERKLNGDTGPGNVASSPSASGNSGSVSLQKNGSQGNQKMRRVNKPHQYQINSRNISKIIAMTQVGFDRKNPLPIGLYGEAVIEFSTENDKYKNYKVWDKNKETYFTLGVSKKWQGNLISIIDHKLNKAIKVYGVFYFYLSSGYTDAFIKVNEVFFK
ncbi:hypothetical protein ACLHIM_07040 [Ligilactobacillus sp. LYQ112]|uniref:hypothetical protein n=1 Tax=Ligilactobacillus sp. LYQ112 TaxID=3391060 RepID=UPI003983BF41